MRVLVALLIFTSSFTIAQVPEQPVYKKKAFVDSAGHYVQQATLPVYLFVADSPDGKPVHIKSESGQEMKIEGHGVHAFKHLNTLTNESDVFQIYADGIAPVTSVSFSGATTFVKGDRQYYGPGLTVSLKANDEMSGLEGIYHSINGAAYNSYALPDFSKEGKYDYRFYSVDKTGNTENVKTRSFIVDKTAPQSFHNIVGISSENVISTNSTIYLTVGDTLSGVARTYYKFDKEIFRPYLGGNIIFTILPDGDHSLTYYSVDNVGNKEAEKTVNFYLDKKAPIMSADVLGDKFIVGDRVYFSGRTKLKLTAVDNKSGIKDMMFSINDEPFGKYEEPFYLPNRSGIHSVRYYAVDNTNNTIKDDFEHSVGVIYVDLTGPTLSHSFSGPQFVKADTILVSPKTKLVLTGSDPESGLKKLAYSFDNTVEETTYPSKPVDITLKGLHTLGYFGYDNVNNKNAKSALFYVDVEGPEINSQFAVAPSKDGKYPSYTSLFLSATDKEVGAGEIRYTINGGKEQVYIAPIKGFVKNSDYVVKIKAIDLLGNVSETTVKFKTDRY